MSKAKALRALKRRRMMATNGYAGHLLDLWLATGCADDFEFPGGNDRHWRSYLKSQRFKNRKTRQAVKP